MAFPERPVTVTEPLDVSTFDRLALSRVKVGTMITGINGSDSVWKVIQPGHFKIVSKAEASEAEDV